MPGGIFSGLTSLTNLLFSDNELTELPRGIFSGLPSLVGLDVAENTTDPLPLNVTLQETTIGMARVEIPQVVPFTSVTVNLSITGGTFGSGTDTTTSVTINKGESQSSEFAFTVAEPTMMMMMEMPEATISIASTVSNPTEIEDDFGNRMGYSGLTLASGDDLVRQMGICSRTAVVQTAILAAITPTDCAMVTIDDLRGITGTLDLMSESIAALKSGDFAGLTSLEILDLVDNSLTTLPATIFAGLTALQELHLSHNSLSMLPADIFRGLESLTVLTLNSNSLTMLDADIFDGLDALMELELSTNSLGTLDADIFDGLSALENLNLLSTGLTALDTDIFDGLDALTVLNLNSNSLETLDADIFNRLSSLIFLNLGSNNLTALPPEMFSGLTNLMAVEVSGNPDTDPALFTLTVTPKESGDGRAVIEVIEGVPFDVTATVTITGGELSDRMTTMDVMIETGETQSDEFTYIETDLLTTITVSNPGSDSEDIETGFGFDSTAVGFFSGYSGFALASGDPLVIGDGICSRTPEVQTAILAELNDVTPPPNPAIVCDAVTNALLGMITGTLSLGDTTPIDDTDDITTLLAGDFDGLTNLLSVDLSSNLLTGLPAGLFSELENLRHLFLQGNSLMTLPEGIFSGLTRLQLLNLSNNSLSTLNADSFSGLTALTSLFLLNNDLPSLPEGLFSVLNTLTSVNVAGNPNDDSPAFTLIVTPKETTPGMAVIEVVEGVPFQLTATVSIIGGTFPDGTTTVTIEKGMTQSDPFPYALTPDEIATVLTVSSPTAVDSSNMEINILDGITNSVSGYEGFALAAGEPLILGDRDGICSRTPQVRDGILEEINDPSDPDRPDPAVTCLTVTNALLATISGTLSLRDPTINDGPGETEDDITALQAGDFAGLSGVTTLNLANNSLMTLPADIFSGLSALTSLNLTGNDLMTLDAGAFSGLSALTSLTLTGNSLETLNVGTFSGLGNLEGLFLQFNSLSTLDAGAFSGLGSLQTLNLSENSLSTLPATIFSGLADTLTGLSLNDNDFTELPAGIFSGLANLTIVNVENNPNSGNILPLIATPVATTESIGGASGMAVVEIAPGVPFTSVTVDVSISGGTFAANATTMENVTISKGSTRSVEFEYTADPTEIATVLTVSNLRSVPENIRDAIDRTGTGSNGFELVGAPLIFGDGICNRTEQVQTRILVEDF